MTRPGPPGQEPVRYSRLDDPNLSPWWTRPLAFVYQYVQLQLEGSQVTEELSLHHFGPTLSKFQSRMMPRLERCHPPSPQARPSSPHFFAAACPAMVTQTRGSKE